jgi:hypothetical protein
MIIEQSPRVKIPKNKDKKYDNFTKCKFVMCKISQINSSRFWLWQFGLRIIACQFFLPNQCLWVLSLVWWYLLSHIKNPSSKTVMFPILCRHSQHMKKKRQCISEANNIATSFCCVQRQSQTYSTVSFCKSQQEVDFTYVTHYQTYLLFCHIVSFYGILHAVKTV